ncbi:MAG: hypothetical protein GY850_06845 [bacterium]|nr:hypothetical protein [bacterium]
MFRNMLLVKIIILSMIFAAAPFLFGFTFSRAIEENGKSYIVDLHGERRDVTQAKSLGFDPEKFRHGIGRNAVMGSSLRLTFVKDSGRCCAPCDESCPQGDSSFCR